MNKHYLVFVTPNSFLAHSTVAIKLCNNWLPFCCCIFGWSMRGRILLGVPWDLVQGANGRKTRCQLLKRRRGLWWGQKDHAFWMLSFVTWALNNTGFWGIHWHLIFLIGLVTESSARCSISSGSDLAPLFVYILLKLLISQILSRNGKIIFTCGSIEMAAVFWKWCSWGWFLIFAVDLFNLKSRHQKSKWDQQASST